jgi:CheY-like chemotaxis protein
MSARHVYPSRSQADTRSSSDSLLQSLDDPTATAVDGLRRDSEASRILIVDDDPNLLKVVSKMASCLGYQPTTATDAVDALYYLTKTPYDVVITDYHMPLMDGYQLADRIKRKFVETKVIIMTGHGDAELVHRFDGSGIVDGLLLKPFNLKTMQEKIEQAEHAYPETWTD